MVHCPHTLELNILEDNIKKMKTEIIGIKDKESAARWKLIRRHRILPLFPLALTYWAIFGGSIPALLVFLLVYLFLRYRW